MQWPDFFALFVTLRRLSQCASQSPSVAIASPTEGALFDEPQAGTGTMNRPGAKIPVNSCGAEVTGHMFTVEKALLAPDCCDDWSELCPGGEDWQDTVSVIPLVSHRIYSRLTRGQKRKALWTISLRFVILTPLGGTKLPNRASWSLRW